MAFNSAINLSLKKRFAAAALAAALAAAFGGAAMAPGVAFADPAAGGDSAAGGTTDTTTGTDKDKTDADAATAKDEADKKAAKDADDLITKIGAVKGDTETKDRIDAARAAYDALTADQQKLVKGLDALKAAEEAYPKALAKRAAAEKAAKIQRMYNPFSGEHFYTGDAAEVADLKKAGWNDEGIGWVSLNKTDTDATPVFRLYNKWTGEHHYTTDEAERDACVKAGWSDEDIEFYASTKEATGLGAVYRQYNPFAAAFTHNWTMDAKENKSLAEKGWKEEGVAWYAVNPMPQTPEDNADGMVYRMYNPYTGEHIFTVDVAEIQATKDAGWKFEDVAWAGAKKDDAGACEVYRVYNPYSGDHLYTLDKEEVKALVEAGWNDEGTVFYAFSEQSIKDLPNVDEFKPIYRSYNPYAKVGSHHMTGDKKEHDALVEIGWKDEKIAWYYLEVKEPAGDTAADSAKDPATTPDQKN